MSGAVLDEPGLFAGLGELEMVYEPVELRGGHLGVTEDDGPFDEGQVCGDDGRGAFVEPADQVEQLRASSRFCRTRHSEVAIDGLSSDCPVLHIGTQ